MNTKGVEDGISDEQVVLKEGHCGSCGVSATWPHADWCPTWELSAKDRPTFAYHLAIYLTRNGADAPHMQAEINRFLYDGKWKTTQEVGRE